jgi:hypothetical protein
MIYAFFGILPIILVSVVLAAAISVFLLWRYRRDARRGMEQTAGAAAPPRQEGQAGKAPASGSSTLVIQELRGGLSTGLPAEAQDAYDRTARSLWSALAVYSAGGLACALVFSISWAAALRIPFMSAAFLTFFVIFIWPCLLALGLILPIDGGSYAWFVCAYFALFMPLVFYELIRSHSTANIFATIVLFWLFFDFYVTLLLLAFLRRGVRAAGPLVAALTLIGVTATFIAVIFSRNSRSFLEGINEVGLFIGSKVSVLNYLMYVLGFAIFGLLGWWLLVRLGRLYRARRFSEQSLTLDAFWLLAALVQSFTLLISNNWNFLYTAVLAFAAYKLVTLAGFAYLRRRSTASLRPRMLLLLRVFGVRRGSQRFLDAFTRWWRRSGGISLICSPDQVAAVVEPHEFLDFVGGLPPRQFVEGEADLEQRLAELDRRPDPDGLYRVHQFFCHVDTWQMTLCRLAEQSEAVLVDLCSFSSRNQGSLDVLGCLLDTVDLERVVFLVDDSTDRPFLEETLQRLWGEVAADSPNRRAETLTARLFHAGDQSGYSIKALLLTLFGQPAAVPGTLATAD